MKDAFIRNIVIVSISVFILAGIALAGGWTTGTVFKDANGNTEMNFGIDGAKTAATAAITGSTVHQSSTFPTLTMPSAVEAGFVTCINTGVGSAANARMKINNTGTEIPIVGGSTPVFAVPKGTSTIGFNKYSSATASTDSIKCTFIGH